jgi:hypothetical protein
MHGLVLFSGGSGKILDIFLKPRPNVPFWYGRA